MAEPFIFVNTYRIKPGSEDEYRRAHDEVIELVRAKEPKMRYFAFHVSEDGSEAATVQVHEDADNMAFHMQLVGDHIRLAAQYLDWDSLEIRIYGTPTEPVMEQMRQLAGAGVSLTVSPPVAGFDRFSET